MELRGIRNAGVARPVKAIAIAVLAALTVQRLLTAALVPLTPDEAYYWVWSQALAPGYADHPPMVALWIRFGTALFGNIAFAVRLLGPLAAAAETLLLADAAERLLPGRQAGLIAGSLWNATLLLGAGSIIMTPDAPLLLFWCATLWAMARIATGGNGLWWLAAGAFAGLALVSKYTAAFLWLGIGLWIVTVPPARVWLRRPAPWLGALLGLGLFLPVVLWNKDHGWISFIRQGGRAANWQPDRAFGFLAELIGGQIGLATPGVWLLCAAGLVVTVREAWRHRDPAMTLLAAFSLPAALVFAQHAIGDRVQGNWPAIVYPSAVITAAGLTAQRWRRLVWPSAGLGFALTAAVLLQAMTEAIPLPPRMDPVARQTAGWNALAAAVDAIRRPEGATYVAAEEYALIAELAWNAPAAMSIVGIDSRLAPMDLPLTDMTGRNGFLLRAEHRGPEIDPATWSEATLIGVVDRAGAQGTVERYRLWRVTGRIAGKAMPSR